ncbi:hypothetical protein NSQ43_15840 [Sporosarcina sp. FSL W8-0480]|uniref:hypothetical protein n=1 Tax=Sporosarcina sp. FSL W8-0480 TaxID=2954701 RepID=UPI0030DB8B26
MWHIKNDINKHYLQTFEREIILPYLQMISDVVTEIETGRINKPLQRIDIWKDTEIFTTATDDKKNLFVYIMEKTVSGKKLQDLFISMAERFDSIAVENIIKLYKEQNRHVYSGNYNFPLVQIDELFKDLFVVYFYNTFFADEYIWSTMVGERYNRKAFHRNFKSENKMVVCPYCDIDTAVTVSNNNIEHFLPKSKFPLIAMNPFNLLSSCIACNKADEGKGDRIPDYPILSPYNEMIGDFASFDVDFLSKKITLSNVGKTRHDNYFKFLKLYSRYSDPIVYECVDHAAQSLFETLSNYKAPSKSVIDLYIRRNQKMNNLSFALKSVISNYPEYNALK